MIVQAMSIRQGASGSPLDKWVNNLYFDFTGEPDETDLDGLGVLIESFWNTDMTPFGGTGRLASACSAAVAQNGHTVRFYDAQATPSIPLHIFEYNDVAAHAGASLPSEVAICLSFAAAPVAGANTGPGPHLPARRRGRNYLGPWLQAAVVMDGATPRVGSGVISNMALAAQEFLAFGGDFTWGVYSPTDDVIRPVERLWVDNEFDTVRSRGSVATTRTTITL